MVLKTLSIYKEIFKLQYFLKENIKYWIVILFYGYYL